jgi:Ca2+/Na+ antiporter
MKTQRNLTELDRKEIKNMTRIGFVIPSMIILLAGTLNMYFLLDTKVNFNTQILLLADFAIILLCIFISYKMNRKHFKDLRNGLKRIELAKVSGKHNKTSNEAGSGTLYIPILGDLFPKLWGQKSEPNYLVYFIIDNYRYEVNKELYDKVKEGEIVEMHYSIFGNTLLKIENSKSQFKSG